MKAWIVLVLVIGMFTIMAAAMTGCTTDQIAAVQDALGGLTDATPAIVTNLPPVTPPVATQTSSASLCDPSPSKYNAVTMNWQDIPRRGFISSQECSVEPHYGLLIRCPTWVVSGGKWYMLSDPYKNGRIRLEGSRDNGTLVCETFTEDGMTWECLGATDHELHANQGDTLEAVKANLKTKGNRIPYKHSRVYLVWVCHKAK